MKLKVLLICFIAMLMSTSAFALPGTVDVRATWNPNSETDLAGYKLYYSDSADLGTFTESQSVDVGNVTEYDLGPIPMGSWITITAYDFTGNESAFATPAFYEIHDGVAPAAVDGLRIEIY